MRSRVLICTVVHTMPTFQIVGPTLSPNTRISRVSSTLSTRIIPKVATGSTAEMRAPNAQLSVEKMLVHHTTVDAELVSALARLTSQ